MMFRGAMVIIVVAMIAVIFSVRYAAPPQGYRDAINSLYSNKAERK